MQVGILNLVLRQGKILATDSRIRMGSRLDGPPVLASSQRYCIDSVHYSFIVSSSPELVSLGELLRLDYSMGHLDALCSFPLEVLKWNGKLGHGHSFRAEVAEDSQPNSTLPEQLDDVRCRPLGYGVDYVSSHAILNVYQEFNN